MTGGPTVTTPSTTFAGFSEAEFARRRRGFEEVLAEKGLAHGVLYGANRSGAAVAWLTGWPVTREAHVLVTPGEPDVLLVSFFNHVPEAIRRVPRADVRFAGDAPAATLLELLRHRGAEHASIGLVDRCPTTSTPRCPPAVGWSTCGPNTPAFGCTSPRRRSRH